MTLNSAIKISGLNTHALYFIRKMRNIWATAVTCTIYTLGEEFVNKKRKRSLSLATMTD